MRQTSLCAFSYCAQCLAKKKILMVSIVDDMFSKQAGTATKPNTTTPTKKWAALREPYIVSCTVKKSTSWRRKKHPG